MSLIFKKGERLARTVSTRPTLKCKVGYNDVEAASGGERNEKQDKMEIYESREELED